MNAVAENCGNHQTRVVRQIQTIMKFSDDVRIPVGKLSIRWYATVVKQK